MSAKFAFNSPDEALDALSAKLGVVELDDKVEHDFPIGRVLAEDVLADRNSPAADVSAMDGYAIRLVDLQTPGKIPVAAQSVPGSPPPEMQDGAVVQIFTGAIVPEGAEAVVKREDTEESDGAIEFKEPALQTKIGEHIRRSGENIQAGESVLSAGTLVTTASQAALTNFGALAPQLFRPVRVSVITTGDEVGLFLNHAPKPWQLRNSNQASLSGCLSNQPWINVTKLDHATDDRDALTTLVSGCLEISDAVLLTGGVSMGDYDFVPEIVDRLGGETVFHGLPVRPGKPILGAATSSGKLILGLPGNPVSATIGCKRMALPLLAKMSGQTNWKPLAASVTLEDAGKKTLPLHWMRLVRMTQHGTAQPVISKGSGDLVSLGQSTGFVQVPPGESGAGPWPYYSW